MKTLNTGDKAPDFRAKDQNGIMHVLKDYKGKKLALYFYPKDKTPSCTTEACNLRDNYSMLKRMGIAVLGVSIDSEKSHKKFEEKYQLPFPLLADTDKRMVQDYGVWGPKKFMGREYIGIHRRTFLINEQGRIDFIIEKVVTKNHAQQIVDLWNNVK